MIDITTLSKEEREFLAAIINRLDSGDVKNVGNELLAEFIRALTPVVFQKGYRLGDVLCQGNDAQAFNKALTREKKSPLHMICDRIRAVSGRQGGFTLTESWGGSSLLDTLFLHPGRRLGQSGWDVWTLARIAGHSSIAISARYVHPSEDAVLEAMVQLSGQNSGHGAESMLPGKNSGVLATA